ncbi:MAG: T9SS type A sorting domain-containing protein [Bacteroidetes bacterium]|nr:T9SS type A sorting domain-containing protein [Bacteroidota bacterium]MBU1719878.1 T9SS type A sorting domain-containing protein [Bacteroidota bacterium]
MKTAIIFIVLNFPILVWGQIINHFNHFDSRWNVANTYPAANQQNPNFVATTTTVFGFQGDTLINSEQWLKLYSTNDSLFQNNLSFRGLTKTENDFILYLDTLYQIDTLYNFTLHLGDSVLFNLYGMYPEWIPVIEIDSIQLNGEYYKRFKFAEPNITAFDWLYEEWIEGIGSIHGPLFPIFPVKFSEEIPDSMLVTCTYSDNQQVWHHPSYSSCYVNDVLYIEKQEVLDFRIYPNPFSGRINFQNSRKEDFDLTVFNCLGQVVRQIQITKNSETIDLSELNEGIYMLRFFDHNSIKTVKAIKKP